MELNFKKSQSLTEPALVDNTSSKYTTYIRRNINLVEKEENNSEGGEPTTVSVYEYEEAKLTKQEYLIYLAEQASESNNTEAQMAIAELAESLETNYTELQLAIAEMAETVTTMMN